MAVDKRFYRVIDANLNRLREALRVSEDVTRFVLDSRSLTREIKGIRHAVTKTIETIPQRKDKFLQARSVADDVGRPTHKMEFRRRDYSDLLYANLERAKESLRVLEEFLKLIDRRKSERFKSLRYRLYDVEKKAAERLASLRNTR